MREDSILAEVVVFGFLTLCLAGWAAMFVLDARQGGRSWIKALSLFLAMVVVMGAFLFATGLRR